MDNPKLTRSTKFVSLDTHPANNALVVTYDVSVIASDPKSGQEISRASKRHLQLVKISMLDKLAENGPRPEELTIDLNALSAEVVRQCPLLPKEKLRAGQTLEDIKLHLLYLINRRQGLSGAQQRKVSPTPDRPPSSARFGSATTRRSSSALSKRHRSADPSRTTDPDADVYISILNKAQSIEYLAELKLKQEFREHVDQIKADNNSTGDGKIGDIDNYLDSLYGDPKDRLESLLKMQSLFVHDDKLAELANKRLLVCALARTLIDLSQSSSNDITQCELVLSCLIPLTKYKDIYEQATGEQVNVAAVDIVECHLGSLAAYTGRLLQESKKDCSRICSDKYYNLTSAHLLLLENLLHLDDRIRRPSKELCLTLTGLLQLLDSQLSHDLRTLSKSDKIDRTTWQLSHLMGILKKLGPSREFLDHIRGGPKSARRDKKNQPNDASNKKKESPFLDALLSLINRLQMSRPGSGQVQSDQHAVVTDSLIQSDFYELELLALRLIGAFLVDRRIRLRLVQRNVLKCVLRNLVSLLASRNNLASFNESRVLLVPLDCLYKLTCEQSTLNELWRSKIIIRCLYEYLISASSSLCRVLPRELDLSHRRDAGLLTPMTEIKFEPTCADHYLLSLWSNLTMHLRQNSVHESEPSLVSLRYEYMKSVAKIVNIFTKHQPITNEPMRLMVYLHLKLTANLSHQLSSNNDDQLVRHKALIEEFANTTIQMIDQLEILSPLIVENLWIICNLILKTDESNVEPTMEPCPESLFNLMQKLFSFRQRDFESETDDDLLLVSCVYMAIVAKSKEICGKFDSQRSYNRIIRATNFLLTSKSSDKCILMAALYALTGLTNHRECRQELATLAAASGNQLDDLVPKLAGYMLHPEEDIADLACRLVNRVVETRSGDDLRQEASCSRFNSYNAKWLNAIHASRNEVITPPDEESGGDWLLDDDAELLEDAADIGKPAADATGFRFSGQSSSRKADLMTQTNGSELGDEFDDDDDDFDDSTSYDLQAKLGFDTPDFNVVDSNSMIKHLISRQEFRSRGS